MWERCLRFLRLFIPSWFKVREPHRPPSAIDTAFIRHFEREVHDVFEREAMRKPHGNP
jgi:hypothetical protein